ncbi:transposase [Micromonospora sp. Llam0]|uniref:transposase n=1 Tax=Micromonospora sp. Llam0 TaxID=2485143 RepID=UPI000F46FBBC|nr:transposase [Micromonospora sp. Llam0]
MPAPKKYSDELRERATRLVVEARRDPASAVGAIRRIADQLGVHPEALRGWVKKAETDARRPAGHHQRRRGTPRRVGTGGP